jgi:hypothetical protein
VFQLFDHSSGPSAGDRARLRRVEQKLDLILEHLGLSFVESSHLPPEARALADIVPCRDAMAGLSWRLYHERIRSTVRREGC